MIQNARRAGGGAIACGGQMFVNYRAVLVAMTALALPSAAQADFLLPVAADLERAGWRVLSVDGKPATRFAARGGEIEVVAEASVAFLYFRVPAEVAAANGVSWRWRVDEDIPPTDLAV